MPQGLAKQTRCWSGIIILLAIPMTTAAATQSRELVFGGAAEYRPFHYLDESARPRGFDIALFKRIAGQTGWTTSYQLGDWSGIQQRLAEGGVDVVPMFVSEGRREKYLFTSPVLSTNHYLFGRTGDTPRDSLQDLDDGTMIAAEEGGYGWQLLQELQTKVQVTTTDSEAEAVRLVAENAVEYALVNGEVGTYVINAEKLENVTTLSPPILPVSYAFAVNPQRPELVGDINHALQSLRQRGVIDELRREWLSSSPSWQKSLQRALWIIIPLLLLTLCMAYLFWRNRYRLQEITRTADSEFRRRQEAEQKAEKIAVYDELTGLPKTTFFLQYLKGALDHARRGRQPLAVAILTIIDLEIIQQIAGYSVTENLLKLEAEALARAHQGFIAYLGQGRYGFIFENITDAGHAMEMARSLTRLAGQQYDVGETPIEPHVACGVATFPEHGYEAKDIHRAAEVALTAARQQKQPLLIYEQSMEPDPRNLTLMRDLRSAIESNALDWAFQPKYSLAERRVTGAEMLVRWQHPRYGALPPGLFIPLAEKTGLVKSITRNALRVAIDTARKWGATGSDLNLAVNVSGNDLADNAMVEEIIDRLDGHASLLTLEVTETAIMQDVESVVGNIERLRNAGLRVALDDYGTGYSSLSYLKQLNFDEIKIDMSFVRNMRQSDRDRKITSASIHLGHDLGACVTAEGVEDIATAKLLDSLGCDVLQGYGLARPGTLDAFIQFVGSYTYPHINRTN